MQRVLACLLVLPGLAGCPGRTADAGAVPVERSREAPAPTPPAREVPVPTTQLRVELTSRPLPGGDDGGGAVTARGAGGAVAVTGALSTPTPCYTLSGSARRDGGVVTLTVEARATDGICVQSIGAFSYEATVRGIAAGSYTLRVIHTYPGTGWETRPALDTTITVS